MYKHTDDKGVTTYTDVEVEGSTQVIPAEGNTIKLPKYAGKKNPVEVQKAAYDTFLIVSPQNDSTIRDNNGNIAVSLSVSPELDAANGHSISVYIDDNISSSKGTSLAVTLNNVNRGSHTIYAIVSDAEAKTLIQSNSITVHFKQSSRLH